MPRGSELKPDARPPRTPPLPGIGVAAPFGIVGAYLVAALVAFLLTSLAFVGAADELARGGLAAPAVLLAVHLLALAFLPLAVGGAALHVLPVFLRSRPRPVRCGAALVGLCAGPLLAVGIARAVDALTWSALGVFALGLGLLLWEVASLVAGAPRGKLLVVSRFGVVAAGLNGALSVAVGGVLFSVQWRPWAGITHERLIAIHLHLAVLGCLTLLIVTVGRTLGPMLALAPAAPKRRLPVDELLIAVGTWVATLGLAGASRAVVLVGTALALAGLVRFVALLVRTARGRRTASLEAPLAHFLVGLVFLAQAGVIGALLFAGRRAPAELAAYAVFLLLGWAAGVTLGHVGKLLSLSAWTWWPPGERPKQAAFFARRAWAIEAVAFAVGVELLAVGALLERVVLARGGAVLLVLAAALALGGALWTTWSPGRSGPGSGPGSVPA